MSEKTINSFLWQQHPNIVNHCLLVCLKNPAVQKYCAHGGRYMLWLPYQGWSDIKDEGPLNVTYYKSDQPLLMHEAWRKNNPKNTQRPYCVIARMGRICKDLADNISRFQN